MCQFFSFCSNGRGKYLYLDWDQRQALMKDNPRDYELDSHSSILAFHGINGTQQDKWNKYEYNPLLKSFTVDMINNKDDSKRAESWVNSLDFSKIVKPLILKPIRYPFDKKRKRVTKKDIELLRQWDSVWDSVRDSVRDSVGPSVWDSVWAYVGSLFTGISAWKYMEHEPGEYPFRSAATLWRMGLVPSFDGKIWRLHGHEDARILWEGAVEEVSG